MEKTNPFEGKCGKEITVGDKTHKYFSLPDLADSRVEKLPFSIRVLLESALRNCDEFNVKSTFFSLSLYILQVPTSRPS
jgi:aconitate hydratase